MNVMKNGFVRLTSKACDNLVDNIAKSDLRDLKEKPELVVSLKQQLIEENQKLKNEIEQIKSQLIEVQNRLPKNLHTEQFPLKVPTILHVNKLSGDALLKSNDDRNTSIKSEVKDTKNKSEENLKKELKSKDVNKQSRGREDEKIDSSRLNLLVGKVIEVNRHPDAEKLYVEKIELGEEQPRTVVSGLVDYVEQDKFLNKMVIVLCNLKASKIRGILSEAMVMCASDKENNKVELLEPPKGSEPGDRVVFDQYPGQPDSILNPKKKIWEQISIDLKTDENRVACYKGDPFKVKDKGVVKAPSLANTLIR